MSSVTSYDKPKYSKQDISLSLVSDDSNLQALREDLKKFLIANHKYFTVEGLSKLVSLPPKAVLDLLPKSCLQTINSHRAQTVIIWRSPELAEQDNKEFLREKL